LGRAGGRRDVLAAVEELADELEAEAARGAGDEPGGGTVGGVGHEDSFGGSGPARRADVSRLLSEGPSWGAAPCPAGPGSARPRTARPPLDGALGGAGIQNGGMPQRNTELADFLRRARSECDPTRAGLPADGRARRVPGLRREEVAFLAGVSTDYYAARAGSSHHAVAGGRRRDRPGARARRRGPGPPRRPRRAGHGDAAATGTARAAAAARAVPAARRPRRRPGPRARPPRRRARAEPPGQRSEEHTSELQSRETLVCRLRFEKKKR